MRSRPLCAAAAEAGSEDVPRAVERRPGEIEMLRVSPVVKVVQRSERRATFSRLLPDVRTGKTVARGWGSTTLFVLVKFAMGISGAGGGVLESVTVIVAGGWGR